MLIRLTPDHYLEVVVSTGLILLTVERTPNMGKAMSGMSEVTGRGRAVVIQYTAIRMRT